jgi:hypothetical protein
MNEKGKFPFWAKFCIILAVIVASISLTMTVLSFHLEKEAPQETPEGRENFWVPQESTTSISLLAAGQVVSAETDLPDAVFDRLTFLSNYELAAYTQVSLPSTTSGRALLDAASAAGFNLVNLAQPDVLAEGSDAIAASLAQLSTKDMYSAGINSSSAEQNQLTLFDVEGIRICFMAFTDGLNDDMPQEKPYLVNVYDDESSPTMVFKAASQADVVIVSIAWQGEDGEMPTARQQEIASSLAYAGATVIIGDAGSAIQPVSWIDDTLVFYGLGDLYNDSPDASGLGALGAVTITKISSGASSRIELTNPRVDFISCRRDGEPSAVQMAEESSDADAESTQELIKEKSAVIQAMDDSIRIGGLE